MMRALIIIPLLMSVLDSVPVEDSTNEIEYVEPDYLDALLAEGRYEEFSRLMRIPYPHLSMPRSENSKGDPSRSLDLFEGDILLIPGQEEQARQGINFTRYPRNKWPNNEVPYVISSNYTPAQTTSIQNGINKWNSYNVCIKFVQRTTQRDYCMIFPGSGCYANLGKVGGEQPISLNPNGCFRTGTILHEMMHTCGVMHEQNRPDRDDFVRILPENIPKEWRSQYEKGDGGAYGLQGPYDYSSVMHYPVGAPSTGKPAFEVLKSGVDKSQIGQRNGCTDTDLQKMRTLYNCK